jgi:hypothetical protein
MVVCKDDDIGQTCARDPAAIEQCFRKNAILSLPKRGKAGLIYES